MFPPRRLRSRFLFIFFSRSSRSSPSPPFPPSICVSLISIESLDAFKMGGCLDLLSKTGAKNRKSFFHLYLHFVCLFVEREGLAGVKESLSPFGTRSSQIVGQIQSLGQMQRCWSLESSRSSCLSITHQRGPSKKEPTRGPLSPAWFVFVLVHKLFLLMKPSQFSKEIKLISETLHLS